MDNNISSVPVKEFDSMDHFKFGAKVGYYGLYTLLKGYDESNTAVRIENDTADRIRYSLGEYYNKNYYGCKIYLVNIELNYSTLINIPNPLKKIILVEGNNELHFPSGPILINGDYFYAYFISDHYKKNSMNDEEFNEYILMILNIFIDYISYDHFYKNCRCGIWGFSSYELYLWYAPLHYLWWWVKSLNGCDTSYEFWSNIISYYIVKSKFYIPNYAHIDSERFFKLIYETLNKISLNMPIHAIVSDLQLFIKQYEEIENDGCKHLHEKEDSNE